MPIANLIQEATGTWSTVLYIVAAMDILAAITAIVVLRPMLKRHHERTAEKYGVGAVAASGTSDFSLDQLRAEAAGLRLQLASEIIENETHRPTTPDAMRTEIEGLRRRLVAYQQENRQLRGA